MSDRHHGGGRRDYGGHQGRGHYGGGGGHRRDHGNRQYDGHRGGRGGYGGRGDHHRRDGGGYRGGGGGGEGRRGGGHRYQSSYVGQKRGRDEQEPWDPKKLLIKRLLKLGEPGPLTEDERVHAGDTEEKTFENTVAAVKQQIKFSPDDLAGIILEAVGSCSHKTMHYAVLLGMVNVEEADWVKSFAEAAGNALAQQLAAGEVNGPRLLLRFFASLTHTAVLLPADVLSLMERLMEVANAHVAAGADPSGATWQSWTDQLVYAVLAGLVWGGTKLAAAEEEHTRVMEALTAYMAARPIKESVELRPMFGAASAADASAASDSGGASFLGQLWDAVQALSASESPWHVEGLPLHLLESLRHKLDGTPVELPPIDLPQAVPGLPEGLEQQGPVDKAEAALRLQDRYSPRGGMLILDAQYTEAGRPPAERFVAEEYILDLLNSWDGYRVELVQMLCNSLPLPYDYSGLLCETLFAQLLRLPSPRLCPLAFSSLIAHAALLRPAFPKYLAGSVRQLFLRVQFLAPELVGRLAEVLAHFITNMGFRWPWDKYRLGLDQPPGGPQRTFLVLVLQHLVRLTAWDHPLLRQETPEAFLALLGEAPSFKGMPAPVQLTQSRMKKLLNPQSTDEQQQQQEQPAAAAGGGQDAGAAAPDAMQEDGQQQQQEGNAAAADGAAAEGAAAQAADGGEGGAMDVDAAEGQQQEGGDGEQQPQQQEEEKQEAVVVDPIASWSGKLLGVLQARCGPEHKPLTTEQVLLWIEQEQLESQLGSPEALLRVVATAVFAAGSKSCSHVYVLIERYSSLLQQQVEAVGQEAGQELLLEVLGDMYCQMPTRLHIALSRLTELELLQPQGVITWLASPTRLQLGPAPQEGLAADAWALLNALLQEVFARHQGAVEAQARMVAAVSKAEQLLTIASEEVTAAAEEQERAAEGGEEGGEGGGGRQRIPVPGARGPVSRLQMAKMREDAASRKVTAAQLDVGRQAEVVQRLAVERAEATMTVFSILAGRIAEAADSAAQAAAAVEEAAQQLKRQQQQQQQQDAEMAGEGEGQEQQQQQDEQPAAEDAAAAAAAKAEAARQLVLAQVRGFSMSFRSQVVQLGLTGRVMQAVEQQGLAPDMRAALLGPLGLA